MVIGLYQYTKTKRLQKKMGSYQPLIPPFTKDPLDYTPREAKVYFLWYMDHLDERCKYVTEKAASWLKGSTAMFDYSFESLRYLWDWFLHDLETDLYKNVYPTQGIEHKAPSGNTNLQSLTASDPNEKCISVYSELVLRDIGMYVGQVFVKNYPELLKWELLTKPRSDIDYNHVVISGFKVYYDRLSNKKLKRPRNLNFDPIELTRTVTMRKIDKDILYIDLYDQCLVWKKEADQTIEEVKRYHAEEAEQSKLH